MNLLLLRGLARTRQHWGDFPQLLLKESRHITSVYTLDHKGIGDHSQQKAPGSVADMTDFLMEQWSDLKSHHPELLHQPTLLLGLSLGGMVSLDWVSRYPGDFLGSILINTSSQDSGTFYQRLKPRALKIALFESTRVSTWQQEKAILKMTSNLKVSDPKVLQQWVKIAQAHPVPKKTLFAQLWAAKNFQSPPSINTPLLFMASEQDQMVSVQCSKTLALKYDSPLNLNSTAGHDLPLDDPHWVIQQLDSWILTLKSSMPPQ